MRLYKLNALVSHVPAHYGVVVIDVENEVIRPLFPGLWEIFDDRREIWLESGLGINNEPPADVADLRAMLIDFLPPGKYRYDILMDGKIIINVVMVAEASRVYLFVVTK